MEENPINNVRSEQDNIFDRVCSLQRGLAVLRIKYRTEIGFVSCVFSLKAKYNVINYKLVCCRVYARGSLSNISITVLNIELLLWVGNSDRVLGLLIPTLSERGFKTLVLAQRGILWIKRQWPLLSEEDVSKLQNCIWGRNQSHRRDLRARNQASALSHAVLLRSQCMHASSKFYFHSKKPQLLFILLFPSFASHYCPRQTDNVPRLHQMSVSWSWWRLVETIKLSIQRRWVFLPFFNTHGRSFAKSNKDRNVK